MIWPFTSDEQIRKSETSKLFTKLPVTQNSLWHSSECSFSRTSVPSRESLPPSPLLQLHSWKLSRIAWSLHNSFWSMWARRNSSPSQFYCDGLRHNSASFASQPLCCQKPSSGLEIFMIIDGFCFNFLDQCCFLRVERHSGTAWVWIWKRFLG